MEKRDDSGYFLVGVVVGILAGVLVALLVTPTSGRELRAELAARGWGVRERARPSTGGHALISPPPVR